LSLPGRLWLAYWAGALVVGAIAIALVLTSNHEDRPLPTLVLGLLTGWSFIASGLVARSRSPDNPTGRLMVAFGFVWFLGALAEANGSFVFTLGAALSSLFAAVFVHLLLAYPSGRLTSRLERRFVLFGYLLAGLGPTAVLLFETNAQACSDCPDNAFLAWPSHTTAVALAGVLNGIAGLYLLVLIVVLVRRWRGATPAARRALAPVYISGSAATALLVVASIVGNLSHTVDRAVGWLALGTFVCVPVFFLFGLLRGNLARVGVAKLLVDVPQERTLEETEGVLQRILHDPSLELAYWVADRRGYVDPGWRPYVLAPEELGRSSIPEAVPAPVAEILMDGVRRALDTGEVVTVEYQIQRSRGLRDVESRIVRSGADEVVIIVRDITERKQSEVELERLQTELRDRLVELQASRARIVEAGDAERRRLERNLHDGAQQRLVSLSLTLRLAKARLRENPEAAEELLAAAAEELARALEELRELARGIHPAVLTERGLEPALETLVGRAPIPVAVESELEGRLPPSVEAAAFYVVSEALANVTKYAEASSVEVRVGRANGYAVVEVADDGVGGADPARGSGLRGLADRVEALQGRLEVDSRPGEGTRVRAEIPVR